MALVGASSKQVSRGIRLDEQHCNKVAKRNFQGCRKRYNLDCIPSPVSQTVSSDPEHLTRNKSATQSTAARDIVTHIRLYVIQVQIRGSPPYVTDYERLFDITLHEIGSMCGALQTFTGI